MLKQTIPYLIFFSNMINLRCYQILSLWFSHIGKENDLKVLFSETSFAVKSSLVWCLHPLLMSWFNWKVGLLDDLFSNFMLNKKSDYLVEEMEGNHHQDRAVAAWRVYRRVNINLLIIIRWIKAINLHPQKHIWNFAGQLSVLCYLLDISLWWLNVSEVQCVKMVILSGSVWKANRKRNKK